MYVNVGEKVSANKERIREVVVRRRERVVRREVLEWGCKEYISILRGVEWEKKGDIPKAQVQQPHKPIARSLLRPRESKRRE